MLISFLLTFLLLVGGTTASYRVPYPQGECVRECVPEPFPCPGQTCPPATLATCNRYLSPATDPESDSRPYTYCMPNFDAPCTAARLGCIRCALMQIAVNGCNENERCTDHEKYVVFISRESNDTTGQQCQTAQHWMVVPKRPCTGIESLDAHCTGRPGEQYWTFAWVTALEKGFDPAAGNTWGVLLNAKNSRSQHQAHFRISRLLGAENDPLQPRNLVVDVFRQQAKFNTNWRQPTITWGERSAMFASIFFEGDVREAQLVAKRVRPFYWASKIAKVSMGQGMYGILLTPWSQPAEGKAGKRGKGGAGRLLESSSSSSSRGLNRLQGNVTGFVLTTYFNVRSTVMLSEQLAEPEQCVGSCFAWGG